MGRLTEAVLESVPLALYQRIFRRPCIGINYHMVSDGSLSHVEHVLKYKTAAMFDEDVAYLRENFELISYRDVVARSGAAERPRPRTPITLTFDDGYSQCYSVARPILLRHGAPCTFFIITDSVDNEFLPYANKASLCIARVRELLDTGGEDPLSVVSQTVGTDFDTVEDFARWMRPLYTSDTPNIDRICDVLKIDSDAFLNDHRPFMTSAEIRQLVADGFTVGAHTRRHPYLSNLADERTIEDEIVQSCEYVRDLTGQPSVPFAFPFSAGQLDRAFLERIRRENDCVGYMFDMRGLTIDRPFIVNRIGGDSLDAVSVEESNLPHLMRRAYKGYLRRTIWRQNR
ncbi:MAG: polysaccharide deacetylase family protein [Gemmatimonadota bacterium]